MLLTKRHEKDEEEANASTMKTAMERQRSEAKDDNENNGDDTKSIGTTSTPSPPPPAEVPGRRFSERFYRQSIQGLDEQLIYWQCRVGEEAGGEGQRRNANASATTNTTERTTRKRVAAAETVPTAKTVPTSSSSTTNKTTPPTGTAVPPICGNHNGNAIPPSQRVQTFQQMADEFGLRFNALCEQYFFSLPTNVNVCLVLTIDHRQQMAKISYERTASHWECQPVEQFSFVWPLTDWHQFLWGVRGIFLLFFFGCPRIRMEKRLAIQNANGGTQTAEGETSPIPIIEEPPEEDENDHGNKHTEEGEANGTSNGTFSVTVSHPDLRWERIATDLLLRLVIVPGKRIQFSPQRQQTKKRTKQMGDECLTFEDFNVANDDRGWIRVIEGGGVRKNGQRKITRTEHWLKFSRELFTYAIIGKSAAVFGGIFPCATNGGREQNNSRQIK
ncbi:hypothetical protein niasHS_014022 [Heterodera schachtii]|uniref:Uncharacterized protein n=1 Tax=Heterodera schachtii TaxID=97005 RepID=A0ABD2IR28_HETSC